MKNFLTITARATSLAAIALSLAACEPDGGPGSLNHFSLADAQAPLGGALLPAALPLLAGGSDYGYAPSWDYANDQYFAYGDYVPQDPYDYYGYGDYESDAYGYGDHGYDEYGYGDYGYDSYAPYQNASFYNPSAGSGDFLWLALAALVSGLIGNSPPDYGFNSYDDVQPWAWRTNDGYYRIAEPVYGGQRYYFYQPGATQPFLVRDPYFSYGYRDDRLVALYDRDGRVLTDRAAELQRRAAEAYYDRAADLYRQALRDDRSGVYAQDWEQRRAVVARDDRAWREARAEQAAWREWDKRNEKELRQDWKHESEARKLAAREFASWEKEAYQGPAPRFYAAAEPVRADQSRGFERLAYVRPELETRRQADSSERRIRRDDTPRLGAAAQPDLRRADREQRKVEQRFAAAERQAAREGLAENRQPAGLERQQQARLEQVARAERQRTERQADQQPRAQRQAQERQVRAEQQQRAERQAQQQQARAQQQQRAERQQQARAGEQQRAQRQAQERQVRAEQQQQRAERQQQQARAEQQRAQRQAEQQQARAQQQQRSQQQAQERQVRAEQQRARQQQARAEQQQRAQRQAQEQQARAQQQQQQRAQQQAQAEQARAAQQAQREAERQAQQAAAQPQPQGDGGQERGNGRGKRDKG